ncbi:MAG: hypothetical protein ACK6BM_04710 [Cyanobacteriota bacterium]
MATLPFSAPAIAAVRPAVRLAQRLSPRGAQVQEVARGVGMGFGLALAVLPLVPCGAMAQAQRQGGSARPLQGAPAAGRPQSQRLTGDSPPANPPAASPAALASPPPPLSEAAFAALLRQDNLDQLNQACTQVLQEDNPTRLRQLQERLMVVRPAPQPLPVVLANAEVLLTCRAPHGALTVLNRFGPGPGAGRVQWLLLQWRAATATLDHRRAALALHRLTSGSDARLSQLTLPIRRREDGSVVTRSAVEVLAGHLEARGFSEAAGQLLLWHPVAGAVGADRLGRAVALLQELPVEEREAILERALDQAAAVGAWSLVGDLLDAQAALPSSRAVARRLRLSPRLDDAYGEWLLRRADPSAQVRARQLEEQLRSPQAPGGHAYPSPQPPPAPPSPPSP